MPTYDYECRKCHHRFEVFHGMSDDKPRRCPKCRGRAARVPAAGAGLIFKGSGFYITDYRDKSYADKAREEGAASKGGDAAEPKSAESSKESPAKGADTTKPAKPSSSRGTRKKRASGS
jgi:putative FmdB family regulatory protein